MNMKLKNEYQRIMKESHIVFHTRAFEEKIDRIKIINDTLEMIDKRKIVAIRGGGEHTIHLLQILNTENKEKIDYIIDANNTDIKHGNYKCISNDEMENYKIDVIIISSLAYRRVMEQEIFNKAMNCEIIDFYDIFDCFDGEMDTKHPFYYEESNYERIFTIRKMYERSQNIKMREFFLEQLIEKYLLIYDFINAEKYIKEYVANEFKFSWEYDKIWKQLENLFDKIAQYMRVRKQRTIIIEWIDSLCYDEISKMSFLSKLRGGAMFFENAFTVTPWTTAAMATMLTGKMTIDDRLFEFKKYQKENCTLLKGLEKRGFDYKYIGPWKFGKNYPKEYRDENIDSYKKDGGFTPTATEIQWRALCRMLEDNDNSVYLLHNLLETHPPFESGNMETNITYDDIDCSDIDQRQVVECRDYLDKQIQWYYDNFFSYNIDCIFLSDHGKFEDSNIAHNETRHHILLMVKSKQVKNKHLNKVFGFNNVDSLIYYIIDNSEENFNRLFEKEYVKIQSLDPYSTSVCDLARKRNLTISNSGFQYRGIITEREFYVKNSVGFECYILREDKEKKNEIFNEIYQERINELREYAGDKYLNVYEEDFLKEGRPLYEAIVK